jgi:hypothetical protein
MQTPSSNRADPSQPCACRRRPITALDLTFMSQDARAINCRPTAPMLRSRHVAPRLVNAGVGLSLNRAYGV